MVVVFNTNLWVAQENQYSFKLKWCYLTVPLCIHQAWVRVTFTVPIHHCLSCCHSAGGDFFFPKGSLCLCILSCLSWLLWVWFYLVSPPSSLCLQLLLLFGSCSSPSTLSSNPSAPLHAAIPSLSFLSPDCLKHCVLFLLNPFIQMPFEAWHPFPQF